MIITVSLTVSNDRLAGHLYLERSLLCSGHLYLERSLVCGIQQDRPSKLTGWCLDKNLEYFDGIGSN